MPMKFDPVTGWNNTEVFPSNIQGNHEQVRQNLQKLHDQTRDYVNKYVNYGPDTGAANNLVVAFDPAPVAYSEGYELIVKALNANTGACQIKVNALANVAIKKNGNKDLEAGDIVAEQLLHLKYDGVYFQAVGGLLGAHIADNAAHGIGGLTATVNTHIAESAAKHIKESGSNANGSYIKFDDGTMVCYWSEPSSHTHPNVYASGLYSAQSVIWTFPATFVDSPRVVANSTGYCLTGISINPTNTTVGLVSVANSAGTSAGLRAIAIGRWKA